jgi:hypothetical protein
MLTLVNSKRKIHLIDAFNFYKDTNRKILLIVSWFIKWPKFLDKNKKFKELKIKNEESI